MRSVVKSIGSLYRTRYLRGYALGSLGFCTAWAVDELGHGPEWIEIVKHRLAIDNLPASFEGKRIIQISDLHFSTTVSRRYLERCVERVNKLNGDMVVLTGDYVTVDKRGRFMEQITEVLGGLKAPLGVFGILGNHDYTAADLPRNYKVNDLVKSLEQSGIKVLRNQSKAVSIGNEKLWLVGLGDLWSSDCQPLRAFASVPNNAPTIALVHNPEAIEFLKSTSASAILTGHTHGARKQVPMGVSATSARAASAGMFEINGKSLYINRGLGRHGRPRFRCRPEITVFTLGGRNPLQKASLN